jgi:replication factor C large subunit
MSEMMWVEKYRPKTLTEVVGNEEAKKIFFNWLKKKRKNKRKTALLYGPAGVGKTTLVYAAAKDLKYNVIETNASYYRTKKSILKIANPATSSVSIDRFSRDITDNLLLLDEIDGVYGREDRGGINAILNIIKDSKIPIVMTANFTEIQKLRPLIKRSILIKLRRVRIPFIKAILDKICRIENISAEDKALEKIAHMSRGDVRSAINDLQTLCQDKKNLREEDILLITRNSDLQIIETLNGMFFSKSPEEAMKFINDSVIDFDTLLYAIHDNLPLRYRNPDDFSDAYDILSKADVFRGRIGVEKWHLLSYFFKFLSQTTVLGVKPKPFSISFPPYKWIALSRTKRQRTILETIYKKIGMGCHVSRRLVKSEFLPFLKIWLKNESDTKYRLIDWLELDDYSINFLLNSE